MLTSGESSQITLSRGNFIEIFQITIFLFSDSQLNAYDAFLPFFYKTITYKELTLVKT
jgi:hypothetical protein